MKVVRVKKEQKKKIMDKFRAHPEDTGSASVQIAILSERVNNLSVHFKDHKKDIHSRRGLLGLVGKRRRLLTYLKKKDIKKYEQTIKELELRK